MAEQLLGGDLNEGADYMAVFDTATGPDADYAVRMAESIRAVMAGQPNFSLEYPCDTADEKSWYLAKVSRFIGDGPIRIVVSHENMTEQKRILTELQATEERFYILSQHSRTFYWETDPDGLYTYLGGTTYLILGYEAEELDRKNYSSICTPRMDVMLSKKLPWKI